mmetsp:Transcript_13055/g.35627  ORF Transcript_13055/g.35627 Transcript_13055/m.35627 type:complete len:324 (-) Transcript_13055:50-1021(-)|eukprot:CAMPEP_0177476280 /NCGR_PEP_ID=MMETSP0369-20130122/23489_1 /TAXON_ID=447022 ORGANISM="Scrippsiella hangoei-like, Strain SHHI-4" /NCGR_SAMPLE_ID=MMETSP0369 /ASSEMBLY_ACC=CAM_ASM_000364 /LENGTH=323 /DNA_ID=CAMNT_0018951473 /DNA_START=140 /DNA_END=1111 /DNA_ORIENTATION=+
MEATGDDRAERQPLLSAGGGGAPEYQATGAERAGQDASGQDLSATPQRRVSVSGADGRQQFQAARQGVMRDAVLSRESWRSPLGALFFIVGCLLLAIPPAIIIYIEVRSWQVLIVFGNKPCDQDLVLWLVVRNVMTLTAPRMPAPGDPDLERAERQRTAARWAASLWTAWLVVGFIWTNSCKTCQETNTELFEWVRFLTLFGLLVHVLNIFFPLLFLLGAMAYHAMVARGWLKSPNAASENAIEHTERIEFREGLFGGSGPDAQPAECCCCMEEFGPQKAIVRTPCTHYYHYDCLKEWLKMAKTCPLCRGHLDGQEESAPASV